MTSSQAPIWALILAGGDGTRLQSLTRKIAGDARPKQFCSLLGGETLLEGTRRRIDLLVRSDHQTVVVSRPHEPYYRALDRELAPGRLVEQPANRGTAPGLLYPLLRIADLAGDVPVAVFPSDHEVSDDAAFMHYVQGAVAVVQASPGRVVLLGIEARTPETDYGWIGHGPMPLAIDGEPAFPVRRFWEKPSLPLAERLLDRGCLWNSFIMVGFVTAFLDLVRSAAPALLADFEPVVAAIGTPAEGPVVEKVYARLASTNFSSAVLSRVADRLAVVRVKGIDWSDLGSPERVLACLARMGPSSFHRRGTGLASTP
ncbi:MAG: sugar phosphate nucleotidyltransferase [Candidatus Rokuibacteriota bacterium]